MMHNKLEQLLAAYQDASSKVEQIHSRRQAFAARGIQTMTNLQDACRRLDQAKMRLRDVAGTDEESKTLDEFGQAHMQVIAARASADAFAAAEDESPAGRRAREREVEDLEKSQLEARSQILLEIARIELASIPEATMEILGRAFELVSCSRRAVSSWEAWLAEEVFPRPQDVRLSDVLEAHGMGEVL